MNNLDKYKKAFIESLGIDETIVLENLEYNKIPEWDSIGHMTLISAFEEEFDIAIETDDIVDLGSFKKGIEILKKYKIEIQQSI
tara:strand:- start:3034 stop:3285 length:252 start_codon:yes stop_codon:yes gene_type:complete